MRIFKQKPLVSIVMASYNHAPFVRQAILSALDQDIGNRRIEFIVVDDGSTDGTPDVIEKIEDSRINFVALPQNRRFHARNLALSMAKGRYIAFQNSDDVWEPGKLRAQLEYLESEEDFAACFTGIETIDEAGKAARIAWISDAFTTENRERIKWLRWFFDIGNCLCISSALVRRSAIKDTGDFKPSLVQLSDFDLWIRIAAIGGLHVIAKPLTKMRIIDNQNVSRPTPAVTRRSVIELIDVLNRYTEKPLTGQLGEIFGDVLPPGAASPATRLAGLAAYSRNLSVSHKFFADRLMARLIDNPKSRNEIADFYGASVIHEFIERRGHLRVSFEEGDQSG